MLQLGHRLEVHAEPRADHHHGNGDGRDRGEELDALVGLERRLVEVDVERHEQAFVVAGGGVLEPRKVVAQVAEVRQQLRADHLAVTAGQPLDHVALRPHDRTQVGEVAAHVQHLVHQGLVHRFLGEHVLLQVLEFRTQFLDHRGVIVDQQVDERVGDAVGTAGAHADALPDAFHQRRHRAQRGGVECDEEVLAEEQVELGRVELLRTREVDRVGDDEEVVLVILHLRQRVRLHAVLDREWMELEDALEDRLDLVRSRVVEIHPEQQPPVGPDEPQGLDLEVLTDQPAVTEDEGADHARAAWRAARRVER